MSNIAAVRERVLVLFMNMLGVTVSSVDLDLFDAGILDSASFVALLLELEREFGIKAEIGDVDVDNFRSVSCIAAFVLSHGDPIELDDHPIGRRADL